MQTKNVNEHNHASPTGLSDNGWHSSQTVFLLNRAGKTDLPHPPRGPCATSMACFLYTDLCKNNGQILKQAVRWVADGAGRIAPVLPIVTVFGQVSDS